MVSVTFSAELSVTTCIDFFNVHFKSTLISTGVGGWGDVSGLPALRVLDVCLKLLTWSLTEAFRGILQISFLTLY